MSTRDELIRAGLMENEPGVDPEHDLIAAWVISEKLRDMGWKMILTNRNYRGLPEYRVDLYHPQINIQGGGCRVTGYGEIAPLAICRAVAAALPYLQHAYGR